MAAAEEDVRSIEAENLGDDDELDADLEREFLQQQEAKSRFRFAENGGGGGGRNDADDGEVTRRVVEMVARRDEVEGVMNNVDFGFLKAGFFVAGLTDEFNYERETHNLAPELERLFPRGSRPVPPETVVPNSAPIWRRAAVNKLVLFPEFEQLRDTIFEKKEKFAGQELSGGLLRCEDKVELSEIEFQVPFPKEREEAKWLGLGPPSTSDKYTLSSEMQLSNHFFHKKRKSVSGSSSKVATSLERQYSNGSTSTVESPHFVVQEGRGNDRPRPILEVHSSGAPRLTFSFPGWGVDISKGEKHPSIVSHHADAAPEYNEQLTKRLRRSPDHFASAVGRGKAVEENLGDRSPVLEMPDEILVHVLRRLEIRDLCSSVQTCKRWYAVGLQDELWDHLLGDSDRGLLSDSSSDVLPRWVCKKNLCLSVNVRLRFNVFSKGYDYLRRALREWWDNGLQNSRYSSKAMYSLIRKLTVNNWTLLYEALGVGFTDRADRIANMLLRKLKATGRSTLDGASSELVNGDKIMCNVDMGRLAALYENSKTTYSLAGSTSEFEVHWKSGSVKEVSQMEGMAGKELWESLLKSWDRFKRWLHLISTHCPDLNHEVMVEKSRSTLGTSTPTLYDKGLICFRSQVVLRYGLRNVLQAGFMFLTTHDARGWASEHDMDLLRKSHHFLQELDVPDDFTLPLKSHTKTKLRQCFRSALSTNSKLALRMNDKLNHL